MVPGLEGSVLSPAAWKRLDAAVDLVVTTAVAGPVDVADARLAPRLTEAALTDVLATVPDALLMDAPEGREPAFDTPAAARAAYADFFRERLAAPRRWVEEAVRAQAERPDASPLPYRR